MTIKVKEVVAAYIKLKNFAYYDKRNIYLRAQIADFESEKNFSSRFKEIVEILNSAPKTKSFILSLKDKITHFSTPKKFESTKFQSSQIVSNRTISPRYPISRLSHFINAPVEFHIITAIWLINFGLAFEEQVSSRANGNRLNPHSFKAKNGKTLSLYRLYFSQYKNWRDSALSAAKNTIRKGKDVAIIGLDIKDFFHSVRINISEFDSVIQKKLKSDYLENVNSIFLKGNLLYSKLFNCKVANEFLLPIGLISSGLLSNWYLKDLDKKIEKEISPVFYGRYVDDILIVVKNPKFDFSAKNPVAEFLQRNFVAKSILEEISSKGSENPSGYYIFKDKYKTSLQIQTEKIKIQEFSSKESTAVIDKFESEIAKNASEFQQLPDEDNLEANFEESAVALIYSDTKNKIRSIKEFHEDILGATIFLTKNIFLAQQTSNHQIKKFGNQIVKFLSGIIALEFPHLWEKVFSFFVIAGQKEFFSQFFTNTVSNISKIEPSDNFDENESKNLLAKLKDTLLWCLKKAAASPLSLNPKFWEEVKGKKLIDPSFNDDIDKAINGYRKSNLMPNHLVAIPLANYLLVSRDNSFNYLDSSLPKKLDHQSQFTLDREKIKFSPRFVHFHEASLLEFYKRVCFSREDSIAHEKQLEKSFDVFYEINFPHSVSFRNTSKYKKLKDEFFSETSIDKGGVRIIQNACGSPGNLDLNIGVANLRLPPNYFSENFSGKPVLSSSRRSKIVKILNSARKEKNLDLIVFPETSIPYLWLNMLARFSQKSSIGAVFGIEHIIIQKTALNYACALLPIKLNGTTHVIPIFRVKNHYSPEETRMIKAAKLFVPKVPKPVYHIINWENKYFSIFNCFELADIKHRSIFRSKVDFLIATEFNPDIEYFGNIVESTTRDIHAYFIQCNSSQFGDSRICQPKRSYKKDLLRVKGGRNSILLISKIRIKDLREFQIGNRNKLFKPLPPGFSVSSVKKRINNKNTF